MRRPNFKSLFIFSILLFASFTIVNAQQGLQDRPKEDKMRPMELFRLLGLSQEQMQQIRRINQEKQPAMRQAQERLGNANRALDIAIYSDNLDESAIQARIKEVQAAHDEVIKLRTDIELAVRKVLTPEQLIKFRELREQMKQKMEERRMDRRDITPGERNDMPNRPPLDNRLDNRQNQRPINRPNF